MGKLLDVKKCGYYTSAINFAQEMEKEKVIQILNDIQSEKYVKSLVDEEIEDIVTRICDSDCDTELIEEYVERFWDGTYTVEYDHDSDQYIIFEVKK
jgi:hypothetical protein